MQPRIANSIANQDTFNKSLNTVLSGNISPGNGITFDTNGQPLTFSIDNMAGEIIRIGSSTNPNSLPAHWIANDTNLTIAHNLNKIPYGIILLAAYTKAVVYFGSTPATLTTITLKCSDITTDTTVWILV